MSAASEDVLILENSLALCECCSNMRFCTAQRLLSVVFDMELSSALVQQYNGDSPRIITQNWGGMAEAQELYSSLSDPGWFHEPFPVDPSVLAREQRLLASWGIGGFDGNFVIEWDDPTEEFRTTVTWGGILHITARVTPAFFRRVYFDGDLIEDGPYYDAQFGFQARRPLIEFRGLCQIRVNRISTPQFMGGQDITVIFERDELSLDRTPLDYGVNYSDVSEWAKMAGGSDVDLISVDLSVGPAMRSASGCFDQNAWPNPVGGEFAAYPPSSF